MYPQRGRQATVSLKPAIFIYFIHLLQPGVRVPDFATRDKPEMPTSEITAENRIRALTNGTLLLVSRPASAAIPTLLGSPATPEGTQPEIGTTFKKGRQKYSCVGFRGYTNRAGHTSTLAICRSRCAACGEHFEFMTTLGAWRRREVNRRCARHKRPGVGVMSAPSRKAVELMRCLD